MKDIVIDWKHECQKLRATLYAIKSVCEDCHVINDQGVAGVLLAAGRAYQMAKEALAESPNTNPA